MLGVKALEPSYVVGGKRGQELLDQGRIPEAVETFERVLADLGPESSYGRAVVLERLGCALLVAGAHDRAIERLRAALDVAGRLAPSYEVRRLRRAVRSTQGDALRAAGRVAEARRAYLAAVEIGCELRDARGQGIDQARLGALALSQGDTMEALERYQASLAAVRELKEPAVEAVAWHQLGRVYRRLGDVDAAERHYAEAARLREAQGDLPAADRSWAELVELHREARRLDRAEQWCRTAVEGHRRSGPSLRLAALLATLAELLRDRPECLEEARRAAGHALGIAQSLEPTSAEAWAAYAVLGELHPERGDLRELARRAPGIVAAGRRLGSGPSLGRGVILGRLGRCFGVGGRPDLAAAWLQQGVAMAEGLPESEDAAQLLAMLRAELDSVTGGRGAPEGTEVAAEAGMGSEAIVVTEETVTDYAFDPNLLLDGPRSRRVIRYADEPPVVADEVRPLLVPTTRTWLDRDGRIRFAPPADEPDVRVDGACTLLRRTSREVAVADDTDLVWRLLAAMDGRATWREILTAVPGDERERAGRVLGTLVRAGVVDTSGRPLGRFLHWATRKGVIPAGGLEDDDVLRHAGAGAGRAPDGLPRLSLTAVVPERLRAFHALTRARRSSRVYAGGRLSREELDCLLHTACGVTGELRWAEGEVRLRAYPSSGALYAVGIYPVVLRVEGLEPGVLRFDAEATELAVVRPVDPEWLVRAALPMEREMVAGVAAMVCLTGIFPRHERKYGEGGYRMLVAEAGHVSQNLVLAATALGLAARPFGGVFDRLLNEVLGLDESREQFLLSVVIGR